MTMKNMFHGHELPEQEMTTLHFRNLPKWFQRQDLVDLLHGCGSKGAWDCAYLTPASLPLLFADVNFISHKAAFDAQNVLDGCDRFAYQEGDVPKRNTTDSQVDKTKKAIHIEHKAAKKQDKEQALTTKRSNLEGTQKELDASLAYFDSSSHLASMLPSKICSSMILTPPSS